MGFGCTMTLESLPRCARRSPCKGRALRPPGASSGMSAPRASEEPPATATHPVVSFVNRAIESLVYRRIAEPVAGSAHRYRRELRLGLGKDASSIRGSRGDERSAKGVTMIMRCIRAETRGRFTSAAKRSRRQLVRRRCSPNSPGEPRRRPDGRRSSSRCFLAALAIADSDAAHRRGASPAGPPRHSTAARCSGPRGRDLPCHDRGRSSPEPAGSRREHGFGSGCVDARAGTGRRNRASSGCRDGKGRPVAGSG